MLARCVESRFWDNDDYDCSYYVLNYDVWDIDDYDCSYDMFNHGVWDNDDYDYLV